jgi:membrane-associated protease RseP (regulator of RpoE activity)
VQKRRLIQIGLAVLTLITTTIAGAEWMYGRPLMYYSDGLTFDEVLSGFYYSIPFLGILTFHEFGHYITARYYNIKVTLPYYIPFWLGFIGVPFLIGTMGAFIRILEPIKSRKEYFDVGIAGPLAGFVVALMVLYYGFTHLPDPEHIYTIHPDYAEYGLDYADSVYNEEGSFYLGSNLTFWFFENYVATDKALVPNPYEIIHYPFLFSGFLALFFTAMNLIPIGQLDGGHVLFGLFGRKNHKYISMTIFFALVFFGGIGLFTPWDPMEDLMIGIPIYIGFIFFTLYSTRFNIKDKLLIAVAIFTAQFLLAYFFPKMQGYQGWLAIAFLIGRFMGIYHPPVLYDQPLSRDRQILGWIAFVVFIVSFSPRPFIIT